jgi:hypothetical protein
VGEVKPGYIQAGADQLPENPFLARGRAQGCDNLGPAALACGKARFHQGKTHSSPILSFAETAMASSTFILRVLPDGMRKGPRALLTSRMRSRGKGRILIINMI